MDGGRSIDAAEDVFGVDYTISQGRATALMQTLRGSPWRQRLGDFPVPEARRGS